MYDNKLTRQLLYNQSAQCPRQALQFCHGVDQHQNLLALILVTELTSLLSK